TLDLKTLGGPLLDAVEKRREKAEGKAVIDFAFHCVVNDGGDDTLRELEQVVAYGVPSFKMFTVYREVNLYVNDATVYNVMERLRDLGGIAAVHTENCDIVDYCTARLLAAGQRAPVHYPESRPTFTEVECIRRVLFLARSARAAVYVVHIAAGEAVAAVRQARAEGRPVYGETCPHYLVPTKAMYARPDGYNYVMSPPLRTETDNEALWEGLAVAGWPRSPRTTTPSTWRTSGPARNRSTGRRPAASTSRRGSLSSSRRASSSVGCRSPGWSRWPRPTRPASSGSTRERASSRPGATRT